MIPYDEKLSTYFKYTFRESFKDRITRCSLPWLMENRYILPAGRMHDPGSFLASPPS